MSLLILWWISVEDFNVFLHVSYNENEGPDFPPWQVIWCPVLAGGCQLRKEVGGDTALSEGIEWVVRPDMEGLLGHLHICKLNSVKAQRAIQITCVYSV